MPNIRYVNESPNPNVATFEFDEDILGPFSKIVIAKTSRLLPYSPLAQQLYGKGTDLNRIDFFYRGDKTSGISLSRKALPWDVRQIGVVQNFQADFFRRNEPAIMIEALKQAVKPQAPFNHGNNPVKQLVQKSFIEQVNPALAADGGAMELMNVELKQNGQIFADVALIGSCNGCDSATLTTLKRATDRIKQVLQAVKNGEKNRDNPSIQALDFTEIRVIETPELVLART